MHIYPITKIYVLIDIFIILSMVLSTVKLKGVAMNNPEFAMKLAKLNKGFNPKTILLIGLPIIHVPVLIAYIIIAMMEEDELIELFDKVIKQDEEKEELEQQKEIAKSRLNLNKDKTQVMLNKKLISDCLEEKGIHIDQNLDYEEFMLEVNKYLNTDFSEIRKNTVVHLEELGFDVEDLKAAKTDDEFMEIFTNKKWEKK